MTQSELQRATDLNRQLEGRWVSLFTHLARQTGESTEDLVLSLGEDGHRANLAFARERVEHPHAGFNDLHFLQFPHFAKLAGKKRREVESLGTPPANWLDLVNRRTETLTRYRNHLAHVDRFAYLDTTRQRDAVRQYEEHVRWMEEWFPGIPQLQPGPSREQTGVRAALLSLDRDERGAQILAKELGFGIDRYPVNLVDQDANADLNATLGNLVPRLYRVGGKKVGNGEVALFIAYIDRWPERSAERERYRRRIATAVTRYRDKLLAQRALVVMIDDGMDRAEAERQRGHYEAEFIYPTESATGRGVRTVRATVDLSDPTRYHVDLIESLAIEGLTSVAAVARRWNQAFSVEAVTRTFFAELRDVRDRIARAFVTANPDHPVLGNMDPADFDMKWTSATAAQREMQTQLKALATRQLCRMLFLWFLQQKGWLGSPSASGSRTFLADLYRFRPRHRPDTYFSDVLVPLFFDGIGSPTTTTAHKELRDDFSGRKPPAPCACSPSAPRSQS